ESAPALALMNTGQGKGPEAFRTAMAFFNSTFNWVYVDDKDIAYFHAGRYPERAPGIDPDLPSWGTGQWEWQGLLRTERHPFDLRGQTVLPQALALVHGDSSLRAEIQLLRGWARTGAHRRDRDGDGRYDDDAAVALMDAWYPRLVHAAFDGQLSAVYGLIPMG